MVEEINKAVVYQLAAEEMRFYGHQLREILQQLISSHIKERVAAAILPTLMDRMHFDHLSIGLSGDQMQRIRHNLGQLFHLDTHNTAGRYRLDLSCADQRLAYHILTTVSNDYKLKARAEGTLDTSQHADGVCFRNVQLDGEAIQLDPHWVPEPHGMLQFDFLMPLRPSAWGVVGTAVRPRLRDEDMEEFLEEVELLPVTERERVNLARKTICTHSWSVGDMGAVLSVFHSHRARVELAVMFWGRVRGLSRFFCMLQKHLSIEALGEVMSRLGCLNIWNPNTPEGSYVLDLANADEMKLAEMLLDLADHEGGLATVCPDIQLDGKPLPPGTPLPSKGVLTLRYLAPSKKHFVLRERQHKLTLVGAERAAIDEAVERGEAVDHDIVTEDEEELAHRPPPETPKWTAAPKEVVVSEKPAAPAPQGDDGGEQEGAEGEQGDEEAWAEDDGGGEDKQEPLPESE